MLLRVVVARAFKLIHDWYIDMKAVCPNTLVESLLARVFDLVGLIASSHKSRRSPASWPRPALESPREDIVLRQSVGVAKCNERLTVGHGNTNGGLSLGILRRPVRGVRAGRRFGSQVAALECRKDLACISGLLRRRRLRIMTILNGEVPAQFLQQMNDLSDLLLGEEIDLQIQMRPLFGQVDLTALTYQHDGGRDQSNESQRTLQPGKRRPIKGDPTPSGGGEIVRNPSADQ